MGNYHVIWSTKLRRAGLTRVRLLVALREASRSRSYPSQAQRHYPRSGCTIPRLPDGKPNLSAPAPRTADGKPDLSGLWATPLVRLENPILGTIERTREF